MKPVQVGILGLGTVGGGTVKLMLQNTQEINNRAGRKVEIVQAAALDNSVLQKLDNCDIKFSTDVFDIINNPQIDIVVELIGGVDLAKKCVLKALQNNKHIVTANKALIATCGDEIFALAQRKGLTVAFEAAVAGGIPIIKAMREGLSANKIKTIAGIINGTTNFILSKMADKNTPFAEVLKEAQQKGYAEADPTFDIEGIDAAHKLCIMGSIAFGIPLQFDKVYTEGIDRITSQDVHFALQLGYKIKHLAIAKRTKKGVQMAVHPTLIPKDKLIANVDDVMNAVLIDADALGTSMYYGAGAGELPTASAVVADIIDVSRTLTTDPKNRVPHLALEPDKIQNTNILNMSDITSSYYLNIKVLDKPGVVAKITAILAEKEISIEAVIQQDTKNISSEYVPLIILTRKVQEKYMNEALLKITDLDVVFEYNKIRMEQL
jgi:homoserine dehydrogenase